MGFGMTDDEIFMAYVNKKRVKIESSMDYLVYYLRVKVTEVLKGKKKNDSTK